LVIEIWNVIVPPTVAGLADVIVFVTSMEQNGSSCTDAGCSWGEQGSCSSCALPDAAANVNAHTAAPATPAILVNKLIAPSGENEHGAA
jgi:hypothetical protein